MNTAGAFLWSVLALTASLPAQEDLDRIEGLLDEFFAERMRADRLPGCAFVLVMDGKLVLTKGYGVADLDSERPVDPDLTIWRIGSVTKAVTAMGVLRLIDQGGLTLDDDVADHLPDLAFGGRAFAQPVRVRHLLTHTGGFDQPGSGRNFFVPGDRPSLEQFLRRDLARIRPPGVVSCYDTYGISLAGYLAGQVAGSGYSRFMRRQVFEPLGMNRTWVETPPAARGDLATGYGLVDGRHLPQDYEYYASLPASSIDATAADMGRLLVALLGDGSNEHGRLFSAGTQALLRQPMYQPLPGFAGYCCGFWERFYGDVRLLQHGGTMRGFSCSLYLVPTAKLGWFVVTNRDGETGPPPSVHEALAEQLVGHFLGAPRRPDAAPTTVEIDTERFAGRYASNLYSHLGFEGEGWPPGDDFSEVRAVGPGSIEAFGMLWEAVGPQVFASEDGRLRLGFHADPDGEVRALFQSWDPGTVYEKMSDALLDETLGEGWARREPAPLVAIVRRANSDWAAAANAYESISGSLRGGTAGFALSTYYAGFARARLGELPQAKKLLAAARAALAAVDTSGQPGLQAAFERYGQRCYVETIVAHAVAGDLDGAFASIRASMDSGMTAADLKAAVARHPLLEALRNDPRYRDW